MVTLAGVRVIEMLMQSSTNKIVLLPALPESWADGKVQVFVLVAGLSSIWNGKIEKLYH